MDTIQRRLFNKYLDLFFRQKIFIITVLLISLPVGLAVYLLTPKVYQSTSLLSYQQQKISPNKLSPDVESKIDDIVNTLSQIVTSRTSLEKIINDFDPYPAERAKVPVEDVIEILREDIEIVPLKKGNLFTISYSGSEPEKVVKITNALAAKFIEENLKYRQERAVDTSSYTKQELAMAEKVMTEKDDTMRDYKLKYYNEMPEQREANLSQLNALQGQYRATQDSIQDLERTLVLVQENFNNRRLLLRSAADGEPLDSVQNLANLRATLDGLLLKYTESHPEIIRIRKLIAKMEAEGSDPGSVKSGTAVSPSGRVSKNKNEPYDTVLLQLEAQRKDIRLNIANLENEKTQLKKRIEQYEKWVAATPVREAEWTSLTREYQQLKKHYDSLVAQNLGAESMLNLEVRQKGSQFKIEDPARYTGKPVKPNFLLVMGITILLGLGLGAGGVLALNTFDASIRDPESIESLLSVPLLITIPYVETKAEQRKRKGKLILKASMLLLGCGLVVAMFGHAWVRGYIVI